MKKIKLAIPPGFDQAIVDIVLRRHLLEVTGQSYEPEYEETAGYGGFALVDCPDSDWGAVDAVVKELAPAMEFLNRRDPHGNLRRLSVELKKDRAKAKTEIENLIDDWEKEKHSR